MALRRWSMTRLPLAGRTPREFAPCAQLGYLAFHWSPAELSQSGHDGPAVSAGMPGFPPVKSWIAGSRTAASLAPEPQRKSTRSAVFRQASEPENVRDLGFCVDACGITGLSMPSIPA